MFMSLSMKATIHLGPNHLTNVKTYTNTNFEEFESLFKITQKLIMEHSEEILDVNWLEGSCPSWTRSMLSHDQAIKWAKAKVCVYAYSVLFLGQMNDSKEAIARWESQVEGLEMFLSYQEAVGIEGEAIEFEWNIFPGFSSLAILQEIQKDLARKNIKPEEFKDWIIFISMFNDIDWSKRKNDENCTSNAERVKDYAMTFLQGHWTFPGPGSEEKWCGKSSFSLNGEWDSIANKMVQRFKETSLLCSKASVLWVVGSWRRSMVETPYTSMEMQHTQNSCSKQFILWISSVFTEPWRIGVNNSAWQRNRRDESIYLWTQRWWQVYHLKKYNFWYLLRQRHLETVCEKSFWASKHCPAESSSHGHVKKLTFNIVFQPGWC